LHSKKNTQNGRNPDANAPVRETVAPPDEQLVPETVQAIVDLEQREKVRMTFSDRVADAITAFGGSMLYVWLHVVWFAVWIALNVAMDSFDPFPFGLLTMIVSLEAIFLATFVLISQNRQAILSDKRAKVDLQVNVIAEREVTKLIEMVARIQDHLGLEERHDAAEVQNMQEPTHVASLVNELERAEEELKEESDAPSSAVDTEA
jgi:uncharacterized membrane protein